MEGIPEGERPNFSMHDFFAENEIEYFLKNYTEPAYPTEHRNVAPAGLKMAFDWPRRMTKKVVFLTYSNSAEAKFSRLTLKLQSLINEFRLIFYQSEDGIRNTKGTFCKWHGMDIIE